MKYKSNETIKTGKKRKKSVLLYGTKSYPVQFIMLKCRIGFFFTNYCIIPVVKLKKRNEYLIGCGCVSIPFQLNRFQFLELECRFPLPSLPLSLSPSLTLTVQLLTMEYTYSIGRLGHCI